jgi:hypothetical protein
MDRCLMPPRDQIANPTADPSGRRTSRHPRGVDHRGVARFARQIGRGGPAVRDFFAGRTEVPWRGRAGERPRGIDDARSRRAVVPSNSLDAARSDPDGPRSGFTDWRCAARRAVSRRRGHDASDPAVSRRWSSIFNARSV